jgi:hypothetical protein
VLFSATTGLQINYTKSTFVPINLEEEEQNLISNTLGCPVATFPQTYLGIPLSDSKLRRLGPFPTSRFHGWPGWHALHPGSLLRWPANSNKIHTIRPSFAHPCLHKAPKWFYKEIDKRCRAYFWVRESTANGFDCKVAWDTVCRSMEEGGLNIKNLEIQNSCLLKFIHKFHSPNDSSWAKWIHNYVYKGNKHTTTKMVYGNTPLILNGVGW